MGRRRRLALARARLLTRAVEGHRVGGPDLLGAEVAGFDDACVRVGRGSFDVVEDWPPIAPSPVSSTLSGLDDRPSIAPTPNGTHLAGSWRRCASVLPREWVSAKPFGSIHMRSPSSRPRTPDWPGSGRSSLAVGAGVRVVLLVGLGLLVGRDVALVVAEHDLVVRVARSGSWA